MQYPMQAQMQTVPQIDCCTSFKLAFINYANCEGRARRSEFWYFQLTYYIIFFACYMMMLSSMVSSARYSSSVDSMLSRVLPMMGFLFIYILITFIPQISLTVRRLHDIGRSGWLYLLNLIPFANLYLLYLCCIDSEPNQNQYGPSPKYILPLNAPLNQGNLVQPAVVVVPVSPYPQAGPVPPQVAPYPQPGPVPPQVAPYPQPVPITPQVAPYPQPNPVPPQVSPYPQQNNQGQIPPPQGFAPY
jgi:uncharacterized membrane protein YhaH (DUF805 family)